MDLDTPIPLPSLVDGETDHHQSRDQCSWEGALINFDHKLICRVQSPDAPPHLPKELVLQPKFPTPSTFPEVSSLPSFRLTFQPDSSESQRSEWFKVMCDILHELYRMGHLKGQGYELIIDCLQARDKPTTDNPSVRVYYANNPPGIPRSAPPPVAVPPASSYQPYQPYDPLQPALQPTAGRHLSPTVPASSRWPDPLHRQQQQQPPADGGRRLDQTRDAAGGMEFPPGFAGGGSGAEFSGRQFSPVKSLPQEGGSEASKEAQAKQLEQLRELERLRQQVKEQQEQQQQQPAPAPKPAMHPEFLATAAHTHSAWAFGGLAELIDNARDAQAKRLDIAIQYGQLSGSEETVPMLCIFDDGKGMGFSDMLTMLSFGHKVPDKEDLDHIGRFGVGFKTGSMRLGADVLVLSQSVGSRSIGFLSRSLNKGRDSLLVPVVAYKKTAAGRMVFDLSAHSEQQARDHLASIKQFSPFDEYEIGAEFAKMETWGEAARVGDPATGTRIFIFNLNKTKDNFELDWESNEGDILIRSRRVRNRNNQLTKNVPIDYSLVEYLRVLFLKASMNILVQGKKVKTAVDLTAELEARRRVVGQVKQKRIELRMGRSEEEKKRGCCGMFLYWHGRLIEAYKRVGRMEFNRDAGLGVVGVVDTTPLFVGSAGVLNCKQRFDDTEEYAELIRWMGEKFDQYWDAKFDEYRNIVVGKVEPTDTFEPLPQWVQCDSCAKWRRLPEGKKPSDLPDQWFCYMMDVSCDAPEEAAEQNEITLNIERQKTKGNQSGVAALGKAAHTGGGKDSRTKVSGGGSSGSDDVALPAVGIKRKANVAGMHNEASDSGGQRRVQARETSKIVTRKVKSEDV